MSDKSDKSEKREEGEDIQWGKLIAAGGIVLGSIYWLGGDGLADLFILFTMIVVFPVIFMTCAMFCLYEPIRGFATKFLQTFIDGIFSRLDNIEKKTEKKKGEKVPA